MTSDDDDVVTLADIKKAREIIMTSPLNVHKTPLLKDMTSYFPEIEQSMKLNMKLESMQTTGSFKIRGVVNQMANLPQEVKSGERKLITMSAGNYGKAFAYTLNQLNLSGLCLMPLTAPSNRIALIKSFGVSVEQCPSSELTSEVNRHVERENYIFYHSFDDARLIAGYGSLGCEVVVLPSSEMKKTLTQYAAQNFSVIHPYDDQSFIAGCGSIALEILEDDVRPEVIVVCCGGGGLVSGIAAGIKQSGLADCRIYAVEPEGSRTMFESFRKGEPVTMAVNSVASGLSPPYAGKLTYRCCRKYVEDVVLVSDREILSCMSRLFEIGIVAEPSGCAAMAAILNNRIPDVAGKRVVAIVTGRCNVTLAGKLLMVLDSEKDGMIKKNELFCFCELVYSNLNGTKVTAEVLSGSNKAVNCSSVKTERVNKTLLRKELKDLNTEYLPIVGEVGMALIVSNSPNPSDLFNNFPDEKVEPFIYFVSVGNQKNTSTDDSCHRQYRHINDMSDISTIGSELMENACNPKAYMENNCASTTVIESTISTPSQQATVQMPIVVFGVLGALILAVVIVLCLIFTPKCRRNGKSKEETSVEFTAVDNRVGGISELLYAEGRTFQSNLSRDWQNICSEEQTKKNKENAENCNYLHMKFREDKIDPSIYERMTAKEDSGHTIKAIATN